MTKRYRFLLIQAFHLPKESQYLHRAVDGAKEAMLMNFENVKPLLDDVEWDLHRGPLATYGDWPVETREEFALVAGGRLPIVREACASGKYNGIVLLGGGEPGFPAAREVAREYGIPVTACAFAQMHVASMLGNKFSVIDLAENHNMYYYDLVVHHRFDRRCASIRNINYPLPRPPYTESQVHLAKNRHQRGETSEVVETAVREAVAAIEEDGADVITFGCSALFWLQPVLQKRLNDMGWEVPVLEGYSTAITLCKAMVDLGVNASGLVYPGAHPKKIRRKKTF
ncbi:MAG TPA: aspartate/glutamate racemase family protein [Burkholderiales bacterium]|nr:aspartate/glutamate racemase family protein [Burkholderiales bacterium]